MQTIQELALSVPTAMTDASYAPNTAWHVYIYSLLPLVKAHEIANKATYDDDVTADYIREEKRRFYSGEIVRATYKQRIYGVDKLRQLQGSGKILFEFPRKDSMYELTEYYSGVLDDYLDSESFHPNTQGDVVWVARSFFSWLTQNEHENLERIGAPEIQAFMIHCSEHMTHPRVTCSAVSELCKYLAERRLIQNDRTADDDSFA